MSGVVKRRGLRLKFEREFLDLLLLNNYEPEKDDWDDEDCNCIAIGFRINEAKIECFHIPPESTTYDGYA